MGSMFLVIIFLVQVGANPGAVLVQILCENGAISRIFENILNMLEK